jgi:RNA polymerase sigma factor (sigma-70 family)
MLTAPVRTHRFARSDSDEHLVARVREGDRAAFEEIYERHASGLLSFCRHLLGSLEEAEDAVQHTFLAAHRAMLGDSRELHLKAWLYAIARNRCISMLRGRRERPGLEDEYESAPSTAGLASEVEQREDLRALLGDLAKLPSDQRAALLLAELGAHSHDEIAEVLDVRRDKVKALVFQAREGLIAARDARETPCAEIREELATARGGALRRGRLRRHLDACAGCRAFRDDVARQRAALSILLPVVPSLALKQAVLGGVAAGAAGLGGGAASSALGGAASGAKAAATKLLAVVAVAGSAGGTGYVAVHELHHAPRLPAVSATAGPTRLPVAQAHPVALRVARTPSVQATPLLLVHHTSRAHATRRHHGARHRHQARHHARPAAEKAATAAPAAKVHRRGRGHGKHGHKGKHGGEGDSPPIVVAKGRQPDAVPAAPFTEPQPSQDDDEQGDDGHGDNKHGGKGRKHKHDRRRHGDGNDRKAATAPEPSDEGDQGNGGDGGDGGDGSGDQGDRHGD